MPLEHSCSASELFGVAQQPSERAGHAQVQHRDHDARWYLGNAVPLPNIWQRLTDLLQYRRGCGSGK